MFRKPLGALAAAALVVGCPSAEPPVPTSITISQTNVTLDAVGATHQLSATVIDQDGDPIADATVTWSSGNPQVVTVDNTGLLTSAGNGTTLITASAATVSGQASANVAQVPTEAAAVSGDAQSGLASSPLAAPIVVRVRDRLDNPIPGVAVTFTVTAGGGSANPASTTTDAAGEASTVWTLGPTLGANELETEIAGFPSIVFNASAVLGDPAFVTPQEDGQDQTATVNTAVAVQPSVVVTDGGGLPIAGVMVTFMVNSGGGSITGEDQVTGADGIATVGGWTLGTVAGENTLSAAVTGLDPATITATGVADMATQMLIATTNPQLVAINSPVPDPPGVRLLDQFDNPVTGVDVDFDVVTGGGIVTGSPATSAANGIAQVVEWQLGAAEGTNEMEATVPGLGLGPETFTAEGVMLGPPASVMAFDGDGQTGLTGAPINFPPAVQVFDANGLRVPDAEVVFSVSGGGGSVTGGTQMTDAVGVAAVGSWTIGAGANTLDATVTGMGIAGNPVSFDATGISAEFNIDIIHLMAPSASQAAAFDAAIAFWEQALIGDLPNVDFGAMPKPADLCDVDDPLLADVVDDLLIYSVLEPIDGPGGILGQAGPCLIRSASGLTVVGIMRFDTDDLDDLEDSGQLDDVIRHEMGHVLGFGTLWRLPEFDFLRNPSLPNNPDVDTHFDGPLAIRTFDLVGGATYVAGAKVPVENDGMFGAGTRDSHWRESVFDTELMTGILDPGVPNSMSIVSIASMGDLTYVFNLSAADAYALPGATPAPLASGASIRLVDDVWRGPLYVVNENGRVTATLRR